MCIQDYFLKYFDWRPFRNTFLNKVTGNASKVFGQLANLWLPYYFRRSPGLAYYARRRQEGARVTDAVISLTTFPRRAPYLWLVIETLLRQSMLPHKIVLYLSREQFPSAADVPATLRPYEEAGILEIRMVDGDIRSHKKYWYAVSDFPNEPLITVDDDIIYHSSTIEKLTEAAHSYPGCVPCFWHEMMSWDEQNQILPYSQWKGCTKIEREYTDAFLGSGGGTYFPKGALLSANRPLTDITSICPLADDIWLNAIVRLNGFKLYCISRNGCVPEWNIKGNIKLCTINNGKKQNDVQLANIRKYFIEKEGIDPFRKAVTNRL